MYVLDRLGVRRDPRPDPERGEDVLRAVRERGHAGVEARLLEAGRVTGFDEDGRERQLAERAGERGADEPAADDQDVALARRAHAEPAIRRSIASASFGSSAVSTSGPSRVISTSSSIRMPMPRKRFATFRAPGAM